MSTRGCIAYLSGNDICGVYHHYDSYPSGLGAALFQLRNGAFAASTDIMLYELIDKAPNGWHSIITTSKITNQKIFNPQGKRSDSSMVKNIQLADLAVFNISYCYIFFDSIMTIIARKGKTLSDRYYKEYYDGYVSLGSVCLNDPEPNWMPNENGLYLFSKDDSITDYNDDSDDSDCDEGPTGNELNEPSFPLHLQGITL